MTNKEFDILQESILDDLTTDDNNSRSSSEKIASTISNGAEPNRMLTVSIAFAQDILKMDYLKDFNFLGEILRMEACVQRMGCLGDSVSDVKCRVVFSDIDEAFNKVYWFDVNDITAEAMSEEISDYAVECADSHLAGWRIKPENEIWVDRDYAICIKIIMDFAFNNDDVSDYPYKKFYKEFSMLAAQVKRFERKCEFLSKYDANHITSIILHDSATDDRIVAFEMMKTRLGANSWKASQIIDFYMKLCPDGKYQSSDMYDEKSKEKRLKVEYVSPILTRLYILMHQDDPDYKFWMMGYLTDYKTSTIKTYLFLRPKDLNSTKTTKVSAMDAWINENIIDALTPSDIQRICGQDSKTTIELRFNVGSDFVPENDTKGKSLDSQRIIQAGTRTQLVFKISYHDGSFARFGRPNIGNRYISGTGSDAIQGNYRFKEDLEKGLYGTYGKKHVKQDTAWAQNMH